MNAQAATPASVLERMKAERKASAERFPLTRKQCLEALEKLKRLRKI